jgi:putative membrane-bound dehydrogenase-like protein
MKKIELLFLFTTAVFFFVKCNNKTTAGNEVPVLSVEEAIKDFEIEKGFVVEPVCSEPLIEDPVALCFDEDAAMWVVEMRGYMHDKEGSGENQPLGRIKVLRDTDGDGKYDSAFIFMDSLYMPRAVTVVKGGILLIEPPGLYFIENKNGKAGKRILIDSAFAETGNPEHQPNGLLRGIDNWYYCASSDKRIKAIDGKWVVEKTILRGQWGISNDDKGRLFYNNNSVLLMADNFLPGSFPINENYNNASRKISNVQIASNRVFPRRQTWGVNRGYDKKTLDSTGKLVNVTSSCGPVIYRGDNFPKEYYGNAFSLEPVAYLVKRILLSEDENGLLKGRFPYENKEFLTSTDERFRPVSAYNSPDGCLYIIDMHRGVIQHTTYMTPYLRRHIDSLKLERPISMGRIYRIRWKDNPAAKPLELSGYSSDQLIELFNNPNGMYREMAQRLLVEKADTSVANELRKIMLDKSEPHVRLHALWTLEGLNLITAELLKMAASATDDKMIYQSCLQLLKENKERKKAFEILLTLRKKGNRLAEICFLNSLSGFQKEFYTKTEPLILEIANAFVNDALVTDAIVSGLYGKEILFQKKINSGDTILNKALNKAIAKLLQPKDDKAIAHLNKAEKQSYNEGKQSFTTYCSACHGKDGEGLVNIAPPLALSEWVTGDKDITAKILLDGISGPVEVNGVLYAPPAYAAAMPGLRNNIETNNGEIANVLTYIRNSFGNRASAVTVEEVGKIRAATEANKQAYKAEELKK